MARAPSEIRIGSAAEMASARTRATLSDGRVVGWYGGPGFVVDAELATARPPERLAARFGADHFWERWTAAECCAKALDVPIVLWLREHGLGAGRLPVVTERIGEVVVSHLEVQEALPGGARVP